MGSRSSSDQDSAETDGLHTFNLEKCVQPGQSGYRLVANGAGDIAMSTSPAVRNDRIMIISHKGATTQLSTWMMQPIPGLAPKPQGESLIFKLPHDDYPDDYLMFSAYSDLDHPPCSQSSDWFSADTQVDWFSADTQVDWFSDETKLMHGLASDWFSGDTQVDIRISEALQSASDRDSSQRRMLDHIRGEIIHRMAAELTPRKIRRAERKDPHIACSHKERVAENLKACPLRMPPDALDDEEDQSKEHQKPGEWTGIIGGASQSTSVRRSLAAHDELEISMHSGSTFGGSVHDKLSPLEDMKLAMMASRYDALKSRPRGRAIVLGAH